MTKKILADSTVMTPERERHLIEMCIISSSNEFFARGLLTAAEQKHLIQEKLVMDGGRVMHLSMKGKMKYKEAVHGTKQELVEKHHAMATSDRERRK